MQVNNVLKSLVIKVSKVKFIKIINYKKKGMRNIVMILTLLTKDEVK